MTIIDNNLKIEVWQDIDNPEHVMLDFYGDGPRALLAVGKDDTQRYAFLDLKLDTARKMYEELGKLLHPGPTHGERVEARQRENAPWDTSEPQHSS